MSYYQIRLIPTGILLILCINLSVLNSQEAVPTAGGTITGSGGSVS